MPHPSKHHGNIALVGRLNDFLIAIRLAVSRPKHRHQSPHRVHL
jgi:hypothetical protein